MWFLGKKQKQPSRGVLRRSCSENLQQTYRRTPKPKSDFNKVAKQLYWSHTSAWVFSCKFAAYFQNTFSWEHLWVAASERCLDFPLVLLYNLELLQRIIYCTFVFAIFYIQLFSFNNTRKIFVICLVMYSFLCN